MRWAQVLPLFAFFEVFSLREDYLLYKASVVEGLARLVNSAKTRFSIGRVLAIIEEVLGSLLSVG